MTTLNLTLSTALQTTIETAVTNNGGAVWGYAVYFIDGQNPVWTELITDEGIQHSTGKDKGVFAIDLPETYESGKVYFLLQSQDDTHPYVLYDKADPSSSLIKEESDLNWGFADTWDLRFDSIEVNLQNSAFDAGDLTSVNGFGLPLEFKVVYNEPASDPPSPQSVGYLHSANHLFGTFPVAADTYNIDVIDTFGSGPLSGTNRMAISPTESVGLHGSGGAFRPEDWDAYIDTLKVADTGVVLTGFFDGSKDVNNVFHNGGYYAYSLEWHPDWYPAWDTSWDPSNKGTFFLVPTDESQIKGAIQIWPDQLNNSIYSTLGDAAVYAGTAVDAKDTPYRIFKDVTYESGHYSLNTGANNQWGDVLAEFLTGFSAGFYGATGNSFSPDATNTADLSKNWNWDPEYAFGRNGTAPTYYDHYAEAFYGVSNSYGNGYTDNLMREYDVGGPLISLSNPTNPATNVSNIYVTIFDDAETPTGFTDPVINHVIAGPYTTPVTSTVNAAPTAGANIALVFFHETAILDPETPLFLGIQNGTGWDYVSFELTQATPWNTWTLVRPIEAGGWTLNEGPEGAGQLPGTLVLTGLPVAVSDPADQTSPVLPGPYWYQLNVGGTVTAGVVTGGKTFNIYAEFEADGKFKSDGLAIDGLASISLPADATESTNTFTINFLTDRGSSIDPAYLDLDFTPLATGTTPVYEGGPYSPTTPDAPVVGTAVNDGSLATLPGQDGQDGLAPTGTIVSGEGALYFGWTGSNPWAQTTQTYQETTGAKPIVTAVPMAAYTNKVGALNWAEITIDPTQGPAQPTQWAQGDLDGQWFSGAVSLGNGAYTVTMQEYLAGSSGPGTTAINNASQAITVQVSASELNLALNTGDHAVGLVTPKSGGPSGNWVSLETAGFVGPSGTVLLIYATNADGELVSRDGLSSGAGVTIEDATLASIGVVESDSGADIMQGMQSIYVRDDLQIHFAARHGDGTVEMNLVVTPVDEAPVYVLPNAVSGLLGALAEHPRGLSHAAFFEKAPAVLAKHGLLYIREDVERLHSLPTQDWLGQRFGTVVTDPGHLKVAVGGFVLDIETDNVLSAEAMLATAQRSTGDALIYLEHGAVLDLDLFGNSDITNQLGFIRIDIDPFSGARSVDGVAYGDTDDFRNAVTENLDDGFLFTAGGNFRQGATWTVAGADGYYAPVLISGNGDVFVIGDANTDGHAHVRMFGQNTFGFEELTEGQGADFDYNDMVVRLAPSDDWLM